MRAESIGRHVDRPRARGPPRPWGSYRVPVAVERDGLADRSHRAPRDNLSEPGHAVSVPSAPRQINRPAGKLKNITDPAPTCTRHTDPIPAERVASPSLCLSGLVYFSISPRSSSFIGLSDHPARSNAAETGDRWLRCVHERQRDQQIQLPNARCYRSRMKQTDSRSVSECPGLGSDRIDSSHSSIRVVLPDAGAGVMPTTRLDSQRLLV